jgi:hypothetical protein
MNKFPITLCLLTVCKRSALLFAVFLAFSPSDMDAQSVAELQSHYSGTTAWNASSGDFSFTAPGVINFNRDKEMSGIWAVPVAVKTITIKANVRVTGQLTFQSDCTIVGENQTTSVLYGTDVPAFLHNKGLDSGGDCVPYSAILGKGKITLQIRNLTTLNPVGFMWTGTQGAKIHLDRVRGIDDRGGSHNHSDGLQAAAGSTVRDCYLETGDDAIKVYNEILVENTTIKMIQNCVPIQLGWGDYGDNARGVFRNLTLIGDKGRSQTPAVIVGRRGTYRKHIEIDGIAINHPNAALVSLYEKGMELDLVIKNGNISVKQFRDEMQGTCHSEINGSQKQVNTYHPVGAKPEKEHRSVSEK